MSESNQNQSKPIPNNSTPIVELVVADHLRRANFGHSKYGCYLQPFNGRSALQDLYEELLDASLYIKQKIEEEKRKEYQVTEVYLLLI